MRGFAIDGTDLNGPGKFLLAYDLLGRPHTLRTDEAAMHGRTLACRCRPRVIVNPRGAHVITHRRMRNSRSLYQPWELGH